MWGLWAVECWSKISLGDTGFPEDISGGSLSRWGGIRAGGRGSPTQGGMAQPSGLPKAEPREALLRPPPTGSNAGRRCRNGVCCGCLRSVPLLLLWECWPRSWGSDHAEGAQPCAPQPGQLCSLCTAVTDPTPVFCTRHSGWTGASVAEEL